MVEKTGEVLYETWGNVRRNGGKHMGNCRLRRLLRHLVNSFEVASYIDGTTHKCSDTNLHCFFRTFFLVKRSEEEEIYFSKQN